MSDDTGDENENHPDNKKLTGTEWTALTEKKRGCTDCLCLLILLAAWFAMTIIGFIVTGVITNPNLSKGNPIRYHFQK